MRQLSFLLLLTAVFATPVLFAGCGADESSTPAADNVDHDDDHGDHEGHDDEGHDHEGHDHDGHDDEDHEGHDDE